MIAGWDGEASHPLLSPHPRRHPHADSMILPKTRACAVDAWDEGDADPDRDSMRDNDGFADPEGLSGTNFALMSGKHNVLACEFIHDTETEKKINSQSL